MPVSIGSYYPSYWKGEVSTLAKCGSVLEVQGRYCTLNRDPGLDTMSDDADVSACCEVTDELSTEVHSRLNVQCALQHTGTGRISDPEQ